MKTFYSILFSSVFLLISVHIHAQKKGFKKSYIVNLEGDTTHGYIQDRSAGPFTELYCRIKFHNHGKRRVKRFSPSDILGYHVDGKTYHSFALNEISDFFKIKYILDDAPDNTFLKLIKNSEPIKHYHMEYIHDDNFYVDFIPLLYVNGKDEMVRATQGIFGLKKKALSEYFYDCIKLVEEINKEKTSLKSPNDIFQFYLENCTE